MTGRPFAWQNRVVPTRHRPGWTVETWNPMTERWECSCELPVWRPDQRADAEAWVAAENAKQEGRNLALAGRLN